MAAIVIVFIVLVLNNVRKIRISNTTTFTEGKLDMFTGKHISQKANNELQCSSFQEVLEN